MSWYRERICSNEKGPARVSNIEQRYVAYLLRLWQVNTTESTVWRASLEDPHTGEQKGFADLESLLSFLKKQTDDAVERNESASECFSKSDQDGGK